MGGPSVVTYATWDDTHDVATLTLADQPGAGGWTIGIMFWWDFDAHEVVNAEGYVAHESVRSWTLIDRDLVLEYDQRSAAKLGYPNPQRLRLDLPEARLAEVRDHLIDILGGSTCYAVDSGGRKESG